MLVKEAPGVPWPPREGHMVSYTGAKTFVLSLCCPVVRVQQLLLQEIAFILCLLLTSTITTNVKRTYSLPYQTGGQKTWWRHQMETFSALLALCAGNSPVTGEFTTQRAVTRIFDVFFDLCLNKRLSKQSWGWWFETPSLSLWHHCNELSN